MLASRRAVQPTEASRRSDTDTRALRARRPSLAAPAASQGLNAMRGTRRDVQPERQPMDCNSAAPSHAPTGAFTRKGAVARAEKSPRVLRVE